MIPADFVGMLRDLLGPAGVLEGEDTEPYSTDWRGLHHGRALAVLRPSKTEEVAAIVRRCAEHRVSLVPQGGNTSLVVGATPSREGDQVVLSLARMARVRDVDALDMTITLEAGLTLHAAQQAAAAAGCLLPLSISSEGSAQIGGVLSANAGGNYTVRYGNARDLVLGLEVVLADGQVWNGLRRLRKDNTGYCLRQLFLGAEGTLGVITAAVLKLSPTLRQRETALCAVGSPAAALALFSAFRAADSSAIQAFEYISGAAMALTLASIPGLSSPLASPAKHYALVDLGASRQGDELRRLFEHVLESALEDGTVVDAVVAETETQRLALWKLREEQAEAQRRAGESIKNDVSVPVSRVPALIAEATEAVERLLPGIRVMPFGHIGDGNIHLNLVQPEGAASGVLLDRTEALSGAVNEVVRRLDGSFSAEHGVGQLKTSMMWDWRGGTELSTMRAIKQALDPLGILNPGKGLPPARSAPLTG